MIGLGEYIWSCRIAEYCDKVFNPVHFGETEVKKHRLWAANKRKFVNRCEKVGWTKMDEVRELKGYELKDYIRKHEDLFAKLWKLEFPHERLLF